MRLSGNPTIELVHSTDSCILFEKSFNSESPVTNLNVFYPGNLSVLYVQVRRRKIGSTVGIRPSIPTFRGTFETKHGTEIASS